MTYLAIGITYYNSHRWQTYVSFKEPQAIAELLRNQDPDDYEPDEIILLANGPAGPDLVATFVKDEDYTFEEPDDE